MAIKFIRQPVGAAVAFRPTYEQEDRIAQYMKHRRLTSIAIAMREIIDLGLDAYDRSDEAKMESDEETAA